MDNLGFEKIVNSRVVISAPGKYIIKANGQGNHYTPDEGRTRVIFNSNAMLTEHVELIKGSYADCGDDSNDLQELLNLTSVSFNIQYDADGNEPAWLPSKGESVEALFGMVENRDGDQVLRVTAVNPIKVTATRKASFGSLFGGEEPVMSKQEEQTV